MIHGGTHFAQSDVQVVVQTAGVRHVGVHPLLKRELGAAAHVISLPVAGAGRAFAPVFLHVVAVDNHFVGGTFVKTGEIAAQHAEISTHGQCQCDVVVMYDASVGTDGHVHSLLLEIGVAGFGHLNDCSRLSSSYTFGFPCDADGASSNSHFDEVGACIGQKAESVRIHHISRSNLHLVPIFFADKGNGALLPFGIAQLMYQQMLNMQPLMMMVHMFYQV